MVYSLFGATILLALLCIYFAGRSRKGDSTLKNAVRLIFVLSFTWFTYLYGCWVFVSIYLKYVFAALSVIALVAGFTKHKATQRGTISQLVFGLLFVTLCTLYYTGTTGTPQTLNLSLPFKHGRYLVFQGGKGLPTNLFHYSYRGTIYAMDLIKLDNTGNRAKKIFSTNLNDYQTFGDTVYSPCNGIIEKAESENPDNIPPSRKRGRTNTNNVLIDAGSYYVFMAHLKQYSLLVHDGDTVKTGQPLAQAGNSGFSLEPHLHIQAHIKESGVPWYRGTPLYLLFNDHSYLLFQTIDAIN